MSLYYFANHRTDDQLDQMRRLEAAGICLFCPQRLAEDPDQCVVHRGAHWTVVRNRFPYRQTRLHYLLVPDEHVIDMVDLSEPAQLAFWTALAWVRDHHGLTYYGLAARNGDCEHTGGTVRHLHIHLIQGDIDDPGHQGVRVRLSSRPHTSSRRPREATRGLG
jgi:diadenosine tetraphosphate (Ap4A) HIT family hydrolase